MLNKSQFLIREQTILTIQTNLRSTDQTENTTIFYRNFSLNSLFNFCKSMYLRQLTTLLHLLITMKAYYHKIKVGFVLEFWQILLPTAAIFEFETRMSPDFCRKRKLVRYKSTNSEKILHNQES